MKYADRVRETSATTGTGTYSLAGAATGFRTFVAAVGNGAQVGYCVENGSDWEVGIGTVTDATPDTLSRDKILASSNGGAAVDWGAGAKNVFLTSPARTFDGTPLPHLCQGRLTLESGAPVSTSDQTSKTTVYFAPYAGNRVALFDGVEWKVHTFSELSLALGTLTADKNYDVFLYDNAGALALELSAAWTNDSTRADALTTQDGVLLKSGATTRRYLGTIRTTSTTTTEDSAAKRFVWNHQQRVPRRLSRLESADSWTYTTAAWRQANGSAANQVEVVCGAATSIEATAGATTSQSTASVQRLVGIGLDATNAIASGCLTGDMTGATAISAKASLRATLAAGYHYLAWLEYSVASGTSTWFGDAGSPAIYGNGIVATWEC